MLKTVPLFLICLFGVSFGIEAQKPHAVLHPDSVHLYIEPLSVDTFPAARMGFEKRLNTRDISKARGWRAGGITMICVGATGIAVPGSMFTVMTFVYEPFFIFPASATIAASTGMIIGGVKMIQKGNSIDGGVNVGVIPVIDPWNGRYGAQFSLSF